MQARLLNEKDVENNLRAEVVNKIVGAVEGETLIYKILEEKRELNTELARTILTTARQLTEDTIEYRQLISEEHPEWHLNSWDAGYCQLKRLWKLAKPEEFKQSRKLFLEFKEQLRPKLYELGILK